MTQKRLTIAAEAAAVIADLIRVFSPPLCIHLLKAVSVMTHRRVTRRHFPPLLSLFEADTRMGHRHTPLPLTNTSLSLS